jgi:16S rRNA (guanine(966)-N(2))-methyltransferase RsmD
VSLRLSGGRKLQSPPGQTARPTPARVRLAVMNMLAPRLPGCRWLDLCCGSGVMACEALQRGAAAVVAVEQDRRMGVIARANLEAVRGGLGRPAQVEVHGSWVERWLRHPAATPFDLIYADPPYAAGLYGPITTLVHAGHWLGPGGLLLLECATAAPPEISGPWTVEQERRYGTTTLLVLSAGS